MVNIYKITNNINQKVYIGQTILSIEERFKKHKKNSSYLKLKHLPLYQAFNKYKFENFSIELLEKIKIEKADEREIYWISYYNSYNSGGYNATLGGMGNRRITKNKKNYKNNKLYYTCLDCGKLVTKKNSRCIKCSNIIRTKPVPIEKELLKSLIRKETFVDISKMFNVSEKVVLKWCKKYNLPFRKKDINNITDENWNSNNYIVEIKEKIISEKNKPIPVYQYSKENNFIQKFPSSAEAARWLEKEGYVNGNLSGVRSHIREVITGKRKTAHGFIWKNL